MSAPVEDQEDMDFSKYDQEWPSDRPVEEWVPGDPMPGYWAGDFSDTIFYIKDDRPYCDQGVWLYKSREPLCWCQQEADHINSFSAFRWTPDLPEIEPWLTDEEEAASWVASTLQDEEELLGL